MNKLTSTAKTLDRIFKVLRILVLIAGILCLAVMALWGMAQLLAPNTLEEVADVLILGPVQLTLASDAGLTASQATVRLLVEMVTVLVCVAALIVFINCVHRILAPIMEGKPFHDTVSKNLMKLAWVEIALGIVYNMLTVGEAIMVNRFYRLPELFSDSHVTKVSGCYYEADLSFLVTAAIFFLMSYIFSYGAQLQKLSDETL